jgi:hypothetical protein
LEIFTFAELKNRVEKVIPKLVGDDEGIQSSALQLTAAVGRCSQELADTLDPDGGISDPERLDAVAWSLAEALIFLQHVATVTGVNLDSAASLRLTELGG